MPDQSEPLNPADRQNADTLSALGKPRPISEGEIKQAIREAIAELWPALAELAKIERPMAAKP
jgi:hypothetical protein